TPHEFISKWKKAQLSERSAAQQHFLDLCELLGQPKPAAADPEGAWYTFERGVHKTGGGDGRNLLIGGLGADVLQGWVEQDILIGGTTNYDQNAIALRAIMSEWTRTELDYATRIAQLNGSQAGGTNGAFLLNATTVHDDGATNVLFGGQDLDWF